MIRAIHVTKIIEYPDLIEKFNIPLDEYPRRCVKQINDWKERSKLLLSGKEIEHARSCEYASRIIEAIMTNSTYEIGGNVINNGLIDNLPSDACVEVPCLINGNGVQPTYVGKLPVQCAAMNMTNINCQLLTIDSAVCGKKDRLYQAAMLEPHTASELSIDDIIKMCNEMLDAHEKAGFPIFD